MHIAWISTATVSHVLNLTDTYSVQFSYSLVSDSLQPHESQHVRLLCPLPISLSLLRLMSTESVMPFNYLVLCRPLLFLPSMFSSIRVFSNESPLCIRSPKYWSFSISPSKTIQGWFPLELTDLISLQSKGLSSIFSSTAIQKHQFFATQHSLWSNSHIHTWLLEKP